jgi:hypothetical protein
MTHHASQRQDVVGINFVFSKSSRCLVLFSVVGRDGPDPRAFDGEACTPLVDEA